MAIFTKCTASYPLLKSGEASHIIPVMSSYDFLSPSTARLTTESTYGLTVMGPGPSDPKEPTGPRLPDDEDLGISVVVRPRTRTRKPSMYKVLMLNDDYTPMEFVVHVLERFFSMNREEATAVMLQVHQRGVGVCGVFTYEVAESKVAQVMDLARQNQHPLQCTIEKD
ncbi:Clp protease ClpS [Gluconobacter japonicus]|nr:Clp protease ClpS [Gluconobacter japonicus]